MPRTATKSHKKSEIKESKKYTNLIEAYGAFWHRGYTEWAGTSSRSEYWLAYLMNWLIALLWFLLISVTGFEAGAAGFVLSPVSMILSLGFFIFALALIIPIISMTVRRLHDAGLSAWWMLLLLLGVVCEPLGFVVSVVFFVFSVLPTKVEGNPYHKFNK